MRQTSPGSKAIVFSQFVNMLDLIRWRLHSDPHLSKMGLGYRGLHGGMNVKARDVCLKEFREDSNVRVLLMSLKAGGVALNLTGTRVDFILSFLVIMITDSFLYTRIFPQLPIIFTSWTHGGIPLQKCRQ